MVQIFGTTKCKGSRAAQRFFSDRRIPVQVIDLREKGLSRGELASVARGVGGIVRLYDPESPLVKELGLSYAIPSEARLQVLLQEHPRLLRTPIVRDGDRAVVGTDEAGWKALVEAAKAKG